MGKRSIKEDKNVYQVARESQNLTRDEASELLEFISASKIEKIENGTNEPRPDEVLAFAKAYRCPELTLNYCTKECPIGKKYIPEIKAADLYQIVVELLSVSNSMNQKKERLISICEDGIITDDERPDFERICGELERISAISGQLKLWIEKQL